MPLLPFSDASPPTTNASLLTSGTLADARLSSNVPLIASANTFTAGQTITAAANTSALTASYSVTGANTTPLLNLSGTWNTTGVVTGLKLNITDTASASTSLLLDLQRGGTSFTKVDKFGNLTTQQISASGQIVTSNLIAINSATQPLLWNYDTYLYRDAANTLAQRNGTNAQTKRIYNTYTDASNYERGFMRWNSNVLEIGTEAGGTGTARRLNLVSSESVDIYAGTTSRMASISVSQVTFFTSVNYRYYSGAGDPTTATSPFNNGAGTCAVYRNTTTGVVRLWVNNAGTMVSTILV